MNRHLFPGHLETTLSLRALAACRFAGTNGGNCKRNSKKVFFHYYRNMIQTMQSTSRVFLVSFLSDKGS